MLKEMLKVNLTFNHEDIMIIQGAASRANMKEVSWSDEGITKMVIHGITSEMSFWRFVDELNSWGIWFEWHNMVIMMAA